MYAPPILRLTALCALVAACQPRTSDGGGPRPTDGGRLISEAQIRDSEAATAWEVLERFAPEVALRQDRAGRPSSVSTRGRSSIYTRNELLLLLDNVQVSDALALAAIPARDVQTIQIYSASEGTARFGLRAANGAIAVRTHQSVD